MAAIKAMVLAGMAVVMKTGRLNGRKFEPDFAMTQAIVNVVDVSQAKATKPSDEQMILHDGPEGQPEEAAAKYKSQKEGVPDGFEGINAVVRSFVGASRVCMDAPEVQAAACGDDSLDMERASKQQLAQWAKAAAGGGYVGPAGARGAGGRGGEEWPDRSDGGGDERSAGGAAAAAGGAGRRGGGQPAER